MSYTFLLFLFFFFFKQKTAYEIVPCDWSSDVCSSDLKFNEKYNRSADWYEALGYEAVRVSLEAIHRAGTTDRATVRNAITQLKMESLLPGGFLAFPEQYGGQAQYLFVVQQNLPDGSAPVIYPRIAAVKEGVAPNPVCAGSTLAGK